MENTDRGLLLWEEAASSVAWKEAQEHVSCRLEPFWQTGFGCDPFNVVKISCAQCVQEEDHIKVDGGAI